jgi:hypothetical protein
LAATLASFLVEKDLEKKEIDPQIPEMAERLERMEQLLEKLQPSDQGTDDFERLEPRSGSLRSPNSLSTARRTGR